MKKTLIGLTLLLLLAAPVTAQSVPNVSDVTLEDALEDETVCMTINSETALCDGSLDGDTATLIIESETRQSVTLTDAGAMMTGGEMRRQPKILTPGKNRVEFRITIYSGMAAISIDTGDVLFGVPLSEPSSLLSPPYTVSDVQAAGAGAAASVGFVSLLVVGRALSGKDREPERTA